MDKPPGAGHAREAGIEWANAREPGMPGKRTLDGQKPGNQAFTFVDSRTPVVFGSRQVTSHWRQTRGFPVLQVTVELSDLTRCILQRCGEVYKRCI